MEFCASRPVDCRESDLVEERTISTIARLQLRDSLVSLTAVHLLLTYKCDSECDHCFVWSSPDSPGTMSVKQIDKILKQSADIKTVKRIYFEGGEPFLFYPILVKGVEEARKQGFEVGIVSNAYWATDKEDSYRWLEPLARHEIADLSLSMDGHHGSTESRRRTRMALLAAKDLTIPASAISIRGVEFYSCQPQGSSSDGDLYFRGRAAVNLASKAKGKAWRTLDSCPEDPPNITRVHIDSYGNVQFCQGVSIGNVWRKPLRDVIEELKVESHPIIGPLTRGGPCSLSKERGIKPKKKYADACHMCYELRCSLRRRKKFSKTLTPDQAYGVGVKKAT